MELQVINTTDNKHVGEILRIGTPYSVYETISYKGISFKIEEIIYRGKYIILKCSNYVAMLKILEG